MDTPLHVLHGTMTSTADIIDPRHGLTRPVAPCTLLRIAGMQGTTSRHATDPTTLAIDTEPAMAITSAGGNNDVRLPYNKCGCVYQLDVDESYNALGMSALFCGTTEGGDDDNACSVDCERACMEQAVFFRGAGLLRALKMER